VDRSSDSFQRLTGLLEKYQGELEDLKAENEQTTKSVQDFRKEFRDLQDQVTREVDDLGITSRVEALRKEADFLRSSIEKLNRQDPAEVDSEKLQKFRQRLFATNIQIAKLQRRGNQAESVISAFVNRFETDAVRSFNEEVGNLTDEQVITSINSLAGAFRTVGDSAEMNLRERARAAIEALRERLKNMDELDPGEFKRLNAVLDQMEGNLDQLGGTADTFTGAMKEAGQEIKKNFGQMAIQSLTTGFRELGRAIGEGAGAIEAFGEAAKKMLSQLAAMMGRMLIKMGVTNITAGNVAAGAAMIAAGGSLLALSGALGGGSQQDSAQSARSAGGTQRAESDRSFQQTERVPGRRTGGPVMAGQPYKVGEGETEMMIPQVDGQVVPQSAFSQRTQPTRQVVQVRSEMNGQVGLGESMRQLGFELRDLIQEADTSIAEST
jgi:cell division protein FtsB